MVLLESVRGPAPESEDLFRGTVFSPRKFLILAEIMAEIEEA